MKTAVGSKATQTSSCAAILHASDVFFLQGGIGGAAGGWINSGSRVLFQVLLWVPFLFGFSVHHVCAPRLVHKESRQRELGGNAHDG